jgi:hypothetical protein
MRKRRGISGIIFSIISGLVLIGIFLAVLSQFGGDLGAFVQWILKTAWNFVVSVKDIVSDWATFQRLF